MAPAPPVQNAAPLAAPKPAYYGHYILLSDLASLSLFFVGSTVREAAPLAAIGAAAWIPVPAVIHAMKANTGAAVTSVTLRVGLPLVGAVVGWNMASDEPSTGFDGPCGLFGCRLEYAGIGMLVGMVAAMVGDQLVVALNSDSGAPGVPPWQRLSPRWSPSPTPNRSPRRPSRWTIASIAPALLSSGHVVGAALVGCY